jgi:hypothetical protein
MWKDGLKKKQTKFGFQRTLAGESIANLDPIEEAVRQKEKADKSLSERKKREDKRLKVAQRKGQTTLEKEDDCIIDTDLRIDRFEEMIQICKDLIVLIKRADNSPDTDFEPQIVSAYNSLMGINKEIFEDLFCLRDQLKDK